MVYLGFPAQFFKKVKWLLFRYTHYLSKAPCRDAMWWCCSVQKRPFWKIVLEMLDTVSHFCFVVQNYLVNKLHLWTMQYIAKICWSRRTTTPAMPCGDVPVLSTTWYLWVFSSASEVRNSQMVYLGFPAQFFKKVKWLLFRYTHYLSKAPCRDAMWWCCSVQKRPFWKIVLEMLDTVSHFCFVVQNYLVITSPDRIGRVVSGGAKRTHDFYFMRKQWMNEPP